MNIKLFWHILLQNNWWCIVSSQMRILLYSGLYDACESITIGCLGSPKERDHLQKFLVDLYPKVRIDYFSEDVLEYEFATLRLIEKDTSDYIGAYFHTKGVTRPFESNITNWKNWLEEAILNRWVEHCDRVSVQGYDVSSVNRMYSPDHFSGNFWWFNREFINRLPKIDTLDLDNRFAAEQWICMAQGKFYSQEFVEPGEDVFTMKYKKL